MMLSPTRKYRSTAMGQLKKWREGKHRNPECVFQKEWASGRILAWKIKA